ncbi:hypothetical protein K493DRAFT_286877 [Basidiobolus meristosporus CBS 931.73]|uniref:Chloride channel protein n=1 Tax=Basidiobolus meristosporus CBS 931.73 TaxID=1314790 RepID=A0A1Y1Y073_9FUNG|nr:hypothetical protein K493DRAFT_286877 [Basidiobolus meristosporus CBS 931.73]|eukprot:ORX91368.1 hypothetical protein K493DRAFT_286877 [Basidiobolus meristosporus CBS 931.73]
MNSDFTFKRKDLNRRTASPLPSSISPIGVRTSRSNDGRLSQEPNVETDALDWGGDVLERRVAYDNFTTIDWIHDFAKERSRLRKLKKKKGTRGKWLQVSDATQAWIIVFAVGLAAGLIAALIDISSEWLSDLREGYCTTGFYLNKKFCCWEIDDGVSCDYWHNWTGKFWVSYIIYIVTGIGFAVTSGILVKLYAPYAIWDGLAEVKTILGGFIIKGFLGVWTLVIKSLGLILAVASGLSLGKEGPLVHITCCCGNVFLRLFPKYSQNEAKKREILSAASAGGISVAFGAPIGGVLFSLEEVSYYFSDSTMWRSFFCAMVASVVLQMVNPFRTGKLVLFQASYNRDWHGFEMIFFVFLGILGGLLGALIIRLNLRITRIRNTSFIRHYPITEIVIVAAITALISYLNIFMRVDSTELISNLFRECEGNDYYTLCNHNTFASNVGLLIVAAILKIVLTVLTFGIQLPAGIFMPSMVVGACCGRALGILVEAWQRYYPTFWLFASCPPEGSCITPGTYALVGATAALGGVTRMTVSLVVIMFELTGALTYVLPIMIAVMLSKWVGDAFGKGGIYDGVIKLQGYPFLDNKETYNYDFIGSQVMTRVDDLVVIPANSTTLDSLDEIMQFTDYKGFPVVSSLRDMMLIGFISRNELRFAIDQAKRADGISGSSPCYFGTALPVLEATAYVDLRPWMDMTPITASYKLSMETVMELFRKMGIRYLLFVQNGKLHGLLTKKDILRHLAVVHRIQRMDGENRFHSLNLRLNEFDS